MHEADGCGLSHAIGAEQSHDLALGNGEAHFMQGLYRTERL